jgi:hypothetical protein
MSTPRSQARGEKDNLREDEAISVQPLGVLGVELHELIEKDVGNRCHAPENATSQPTIFLCDEREIWEHSHGSTGVSRVAVEGSIDLKKRR